MIKFSHMMCFSNHVVQYRQLYAGTTQAKIIEVIWSEQRKNKNTIGMSP